MKFFTREDFEPVVDTLTSAEMAAKANAKLEERAITIQFETTDDDRKMYVSKYHFTEPGVYLIEYTKHCYHPKDKVSGREGFYKCDCGALVQAATFETVK